MEQINMDATQPQTPDEPVATLTESFMVGDLSQHLLRILRNQIVTWEQKTEQEQADEADRLRQHVRHVVRQAVRIIGAKGCVTIGASVEAVNIKADGIKATLTVPKSSADRHHLFDAAGEEVLIVLPQYRLDFGDVSTADAAPKDGQGAAHGDAGTPADLVSEAAGAAA